MAGVACGAYCALAAAARASAVASVAGATIVALTRSSGTTSRNGHTTAAAARASVTTRTRTTVATTVNGMCRTPVDLEGRIDPDHAVITADRTTGTTGTNRDGMRGKS